MYQRKARPVPMAITCAMAFISDDLSEQEWEQELRSIIRSSMPDLQEQMGIPAFIDLYDDRVSSIIDEELARN